MRLVVTARGVVVAVAAGGERSLPGTGARPTDTVNERSQWKQVADGAQADAPRHCRQVSTALLLRRRIARFGRRAEPRLAPAARALLQSNPGANPSSWRGPEELDAADLGAVARVGRPDACGQPAAKRLQSTCPTVEKRKQKRKPDAREGERGERRRKRCGWGGRAWSGPYRGTGSASSRRVSESRRPVRRARCARNHRWDLRGAMAGLRRRPRAALPAEVRQRPSASECAATCGLRVAESDVRGARVWGGGVRTEVSGGGCCGSAAVLPAAAAGLVGDGLHLSARLHRAGQLDLPHPLRVAACRQRR